ncbi:MAG: NAD(P)/FAD-dependent oxidoreductase [Phycisphaerales bacterium]
MIYDIAIIGAGITGCMLARQLSRYDLKIVLIEKNSDVADETTKANSGIVHSGYDAKPGTLKAELNRKGNPMFDDICRQLDVAFKRIGSLTIASNDTELTQLQKLFHRGIDNGIPQLSLLDKQQLKKIEPNINNNVIAALLAQTAGIVDPFGLAIALAENALDNGVELKLETGITTISYRNSLYELKSRNETINANYVINCAGVHADKINELLCPASFKIKPRKGEYIVYDKKCASLVNHVIFQCPSEKGKGVLVTPTAHGNLMIGPNALEINDKDDYATTPQGIEEIIATASLSVENIPLNMSITNFAGLRAAADKGDFIIEELKEHKGFINVAGIESPGLTASPAIAEYVIDILKNSGLILREKNKYNPIRKPMIHFMQLSDSEKKQLIEREKSFGKIICRCESVTEGEIVDAIRRNAGARSVDGVKRRVRAGMGRCQGGFCLPRIMEILARELKKEESEILKDGVGSYITICHSRASGNPIP